MVNNERDIEEHCEPLHGRDEEECKQNVDEVFRQNQWIEASTLVYWILVVCFEFIESYYKQEQPLAEPRDHIICCVLVILNHKELF